MALPLTLARAQSKPDTLVVRPTAVEAALADRVAGCYEFDTKEANADRAVTRFMRLPPGPIRFSLTKRPAPGWESHSDYSHRFYFEVQTDTHWENGSGLFRSWIRLAGAEDRILVSSPLPMAGVALRVAPRDTDLVGQLTAFTDAIPPDGVSEGSHAIEIHRIACTEVR